MDPRDGTIQCCVLRRPSLPADGRVPPRCRLGHALFIGQCLPIWKRDGSSDALAERDPDADQEWLVGSNPQSEPFTGRDTVGHRVCDAFTGPDTEPERHSLPNAGGERDLERDALGDRYSLYDPDAYCNRDGEPDVDCVGIRVAGRHGDRLRQPDNEWHIFADGDRDALCYWDAKHEPLCHRLPEWNALRDGIPERESLAEPLRLAHGLADVDSLAHTELDADTVVHAEPVADGEPLWDGVAERDLVTVRVADRVAHHVAHELDDDDAFADAHVISHRDAELNCHQDTDGDGLCDPVVERNRHGNSLGHNDAVAHTHVVTDGDSELDWY